jgi:hypothetical protein
MFRRTIAALLLLTGAAALHAQSNDPAVFVAYFWRAKPGQIEAYSDYIRTVAVPIDEDARRAGAFEEVRTVTPAQGATTEWTHLRIFRVKNADQARALGAALDAATARIVPDEAKRKANSERAATLRDFVRQEIWTEMK